MNPEQMKVLSLLEEGKISAEEAARLLEALGKGERRGPIDAETIQQQIRDQVNPVLDRVVNAMDEIPEKFTQDHLPKISKGIGKVVETLTGIVNQGIQFIDSRFLPTFSFEQTYTWQDVEGLASFDVSNVAGRVRVIGEDRPDVFISTRITIPAENQEQANEFLEQHPIELRREGSRLYLAPPTALRMDRPLGIFQRHRYDFECRVPRHFLPMISCISGNASIQNLEFPGQGRLKTISGDLDVQNVKGNLDLHTVDGDITCNGIEGTCEMKVVSGDIEVRDALIAGRLSAVSGEIEVEGRQSEALTLKSISGDLSLKLETRYALSASTTSGDIEVELRPGSAGYLDASSRSGEVQATLPLDGSILAKRHIKGALAGGNAPLFFASFSGDVEIKG